VGVAGALGIRDPRLGLGQGKERKRVRKTERQLLSKNLTFDLENKERRGGIKQWRGEFR